MSIQSEIDKHLSEEGKKLRTIAIVGESGSANIPPNCSVQLHRCSISSLTSEGSVVVIENSTISSITITGGHLTIDRCTISGLLQATDCKITEKLCTVTGDTILSGCSFDGYKNNRSNMEHAVWGKDGSNIKLRDEEHQLPETCVKAQNGTTALLYDCTFIADGCCIDAQEQSSVKSFGCSMHGKRPIKVKQGSELLCSGFVIIEGIQSIAEIEDGSNAKFIKPQKDLVATEFGFIVKGGSVAELVGFLNVKTSSNAAVSCEGGSKFVARKGERITTSGSPMTVKIEDAEVQLIDMIEVVAQGGTAIQTFGDSKFHGHRLSSGLRGVASSGIIAGDNDQFNIVDCKQILGQGAHGVIAGKSCRFTFVDVEGIKGQAGCGVICGDEAVIETTGVESVLGSTADGIRTGKDSLFVAKRTSEIVGNVGYGIIVGNDSKIRYSAGEMIHGKMKNGICAGTGSDIEAVDFKVIQSTGPSMEAILATSTAVFLRGGEKVFSENGAAIKLQGKNNRLVVREVDLVQAPLGAGIRVSNGEVVVKSSTEITAGGRGILVDDESTLDVSNVDDVSGAIAGITVRDSSGTVRAVRVVEGEVGFEIEDSSSLLVTTVEEVGGAIYSVKLDAASSLEIKSSECLGGARVENGSQLTGQSVSFEGNLDVVDSDIRTMAVTIDGAATFTNSSGSLARTVINGVTLVNSGLIVLGASLGTVNMSASSIVGAQGSATCTGTGAAFLARAGSISPSIAGASADAAGLVVIEGTEILTLTF